MKLWWRRVAYPLLRPLKVGDEVLHERSVLELRLEGTPDLAGRGEASPLPGLHREALDALPPLLPQARDLLSRYRTVGGIRLQDLARDHRWRGLPPSLRCGLEAAALQAGGSADTDADGSPLAPPASVAPPASALVDRDLADLDPELARHRCVKVKVGRRAAHLEVAMVRALRRVMGDDAELRLDANRAFSLEAALDFAAEVAAARPVWIEEPLRDPDDLPRFVGTSGLRVALDESLHEPALAGLAVDPGVAAWVLKPALLGVVETFARFHAALSAPNQPCCVVSSSFEGRLGLEFLRELANRAPGLPAPGLGTAEWLGPPDADEWVAVDD